MWTSQQQSGTGAYGRRKIRRRISGSEWQGQFFNAVHGGLEASSASGIKPIDANLVGSFNSQIDRSFFTKLLEMADIDHAGRVIKDAL